MVPTATVSLGRSPRSDIPKSKRRDIFKALAEYRQIDVQVVRANSIPTSSVGDRPRHYTLPSVLSFRKWLLALGQKSHSF